MGRQLTVGCSDIVGIPAAPEDQRRAASESQPGGWTQWLEDGAGPRCFLTCGLSSGAFTPSHLSSQGSVPAFTQTHSLSPPS